MALKSLKEFQNIANKLIIVSDFDYTLTEYGELITHQAFDPEKTLKVNGKEGTLRFFQNDLNSRFSCLEKEAANRLQVLHDWWSESHQILIHSKIRPKDIEKSPQFVKWSPQSCASPRIISAKDLFLMCQRCFPFSWTHLFLPLKLDGMIYDCGSCRSGAKELLQLCELASVPFVIISAGIHDVIEQMIQELLGKLPKNLTIIANKMQFQDEEVASFGPIIHSLNKKSFLREILPSISQTQTKILLLGDCEDDLLDSSFQEKQFSISLNPKCETAGFDLQLKIKDLHPVVEIVKDLCT